MEVAALRFEALGSDCELYALAPAESLERTANWIHQMHGRLTRFEPDSELTQFNARAGEWVEVSPELHSLLEAALDAYVMSDGLVHAAVLPSLLEAGYDRTFDLIAPGVSPQRAPRKPHQIDANAHHIDAKHRASSRDAGGPKKPLAPLPELLEVRGTTARLLKGASIDLGGLAKGWIADKAVERMGPNSLANCGGDLYARGGGETGEGWPVGFGGKTILLKDLGAATSGTTKRRWGEGRHHLIDPRTGAPAVTDLTEVSVLALTALEAEVLAKTALMLGSAHAPHALEGRARGWSLS